MDANFNLSDLRGYFFDKAEKYFSRTFIVKLTLTGVNVSVIFFLNGNDVLSNWITVFIILFVSVLDFILTYFYSKNKGKAEKLRELEFNQVNLHIKPTPKDLSEFYLELPRKFRLGSKLLDLRFNEYYFENENIRFNLLENIYITCQVFKKNLNYYIKRLICFVLVVVTFLFVFFILYTIELYPFSFKQFAPKILLIITTSFFAYNFVDIAISFQRKSEQLADLFNKLSDLDGNTNKIITYLIEYNLILSNSYSTRSKIYSKNYDAIMSAWKIRKDEILNNISIHQISQNINHDFKLLFDNNLQFEGSLIIGSYSSGIEVAGKSDLDMLLVFERTNIDLLEPLDFYQTVCTKLKLFYGDNLRESYPSFIIQNFSDLTLELTPCYKKDDFTYQIVDHDCRQWTDIQPQKTSDHFREFNNKSLGKFYKLLKTVKEWRYDKKIILVQSVYIQTLLYNVMIECVETPEQAILLLFYERLRKLEEIQDPISPFATIKPVKVPDSLKISNLKEIDNAIEQIKQTTNG